MQNTDRKDGNGGVGSMNRKGRKIRYLLRFIPDKPYLKICYRLKHHKKLNIKNPQTFNEKLQWLKLYDRKTEYTVMADKYRVREYVGNICSGKVKMIPLVGGPWNSADEIDIDKLPEQFVLKCNHDSGSVIICRNKEEFDWEAAKKKLNDCMKHNYWYLGREWVYKDIKPCIIAEKYMTDESGSELKDYKIFNFDGKAEMIQVDYDRFGEHKRKLFNTNWKLLHIQLQYIGDKREIAKPKLLKEMLEAAAELAAGIPFLRTDFYVIKNEIYFGELTFYPESGFGKFRPEEWDRKVGEWLVLPKQNTRG